MTKTEEKLKIFIEDLEETILRLHVQLRAWEEEFNQFRKKPLAIKRKERSEAYKKYVWYHSKFHAYYFVLAKLGSDVPKILRRLRGIEMTSSEVWETKAHYTEIYGHFPTDKVFEDKKVIK